MADDDGDDGPALPGSDASVANALNSRYAKGRKLGEGQFGVVYLATDTQTGEPVAIKKIRLGKAKEGVNVTALREIKLLQELRHPNIVRLLAVFPHKQNLNLVFEYMESDLERAIRDPGLVFTPADVKAYMLGLLRAVERCHADWVLHRDIKPANLLLPASGGLKLADFGLARTFGSPGRVFTDAVATRWYRAPELLYGARHYTGAVDMWAVGCVMAELLLRRPYLDGESDMDQLGRIFAARGTPTLAAWPGVESLPAYVAYEPCSAPPARAVFGPGVGGDALDLLDGLLRFDPLRRLTAPQALSHPYFANPPAPTPEARLPRPAAAKVTTRPPEPARAPATAAGRRRLELGSLGDGDVGNITIARHPAPPSAMDCSATAPRPPMTMGPPATRAAGRGGMTCAGDVSMQTVRTTPGHGLRMGLESSGHGLESVDQGLGSVAPMSTDGRPGSSAPPSAFPSLRKRKLDMDEEVQARYGVPGSSH